MVNPGHILTLFPIPSYYIVIPLINFKIKHYKTENKKPYKNWGGTIDDNRKMERVARSLIFTFKVVFVSRISKRRYSRRLEVLVGGIRAEKDRGKAEC